MGPYRNASQPPPPPLPSDGGDDGVLLTMNLVIALCRVVPAVVHHERWGAEPTVALLIALTCAVLLVRTAVRSRRKDPKDHVRS
jgi:hypothetical protein